MKDLYRYWPQPFTCGYCFREFMFWSHLEHCSERKNGNWEKVSTEEVKEKL